MERGRSKFKGMDIATKYPTSTSPKSGEPAPFATQVGASEVSYLNNVSIEEEGERCLQGMFDSVYWNKLWGHLRCQLFTQKGKVRDASRACFTVCMETRSVWAPQMSAIYTEGGGEGYLQCVFCGAHWSKLCVHGHLRSWLFAHCQHRGEGERCLQGVFYSVCWNKLCGHLRCQLLTQKGRVRNAYRVCFTVCMETNCVGTSEVSYLHRRGRCEMPTGCVEWCVLEQTWCIFFMSEPSLKGFKVEVALLSELEFKHQVTTARGEGGRRGMGAWEHWGAVVSRGQEAGWREGMERCSGE